MVRGLDDLSSGRRANLENASHDSHFEFTEGDLSDPETAKKGLGDCLLVFHLAADPEVQRGAQDPERQMKRNLQTTFNLLEAIRLRGAQTRLVFASTSTVYGEPSQIPTREDYGPLLPISVYGATKLACEALISAYAGLVPLQAVLFRFANVVGSRARHGVIVDFVRKLKANPSELEVLGDGTQSKSYMHIEDCVDAFLLSLNEEFWGRRVEVLNIGTEQRTNVLEIANMVIQDMKLGDAKIRTVPGLEGRGWVGDVKVMQLDIGKIRERGWHPKRTSGEAVQRAIDELLAKTEVRSSD